MTKEKHCKTCDERKPSTEFYKTDASMCKECKKEYSRTRYKSQAKPSTDDCKERVIKLEEKVESLEEMVRTLVQELGTLKETISHAMHKQQGDSGKKFADEDDDVIYIPAQDVDSNSIPELDIKATAVQDPNHTYIVDEDTTDEYDIYKTKEDITFLNHMMCLCGKLDVVEAEIRYYDIPYFAEKTEKRYKRLCRNKKELYKEYKMCKKMHLQRFGSTEPDDRIINRYVMIARGGRHDILEDIRCKRKGL
jgi:chaperonin cofactor prefoldin